MNKTLLLSMALAACSQFVVAQTIINGTVTDTKGVPMPGARVQVKGTNESVLTNMDGTFSIVTPTASSKLQAEYVGWSTTTKTGKDGMVIKMGKQNWMQPESYQWFVALNAAFPSDNLKTLKDFNFSPGIMFGRVKNFGWYVKGQYNGTVDDVEYYSDWYTGNDKRKYWSVSGGGIARVYGPLYLYLGAGYAERNVYWEFQSGDYEKHRNDCYEGAMGELGLMVRIKNFLLFGGAQNTFEDFCFDDFDRHVVGNFGIGIYF